MSDNPHHTRRWLINASGAAILSNVLTGGPSSAQVAGTSTTKSQDPDEASADAPISPVTTALCDYVASALDRDMPPEVVAKTKLHTLDTIAAMVSGSRLKAGEMAARYVDSLGGKPQATVIGTGILTSTVNAALANGMSAHGDETDDSHLRGRFHPGCGIVPAALATAEHAGRSGNELLRAVALGYDIGARVIFALGFSKLYTDRHSTHSVATNFGRPQRHLRCCGSSRARCATHSHSLPSRPRAFLTGSATTNMWRRPLISAAWVRVTASQRQP